MHFIIYFIFSFIAIEIIERIIEYYFGINILLELGWFGIVLLYGFKTHIICCILPALYSGYKCRHKCKHKHCE